MKNEIDSEAYELNISYHDDMRNIIFLDDININIDLINKKEDTDKIVHSIMADIVQYASEKGYDEVHYESSECDDSLIDSVLENGFRKISGTSIFICQIK
jgi:hypothetical protein